jgi:hypothetical protein
VQKNRCTRGVVTGPVSRPPRNGKTGAPQRGRGGIGHDWCPYPFLLVAERRSQIAVFDVERLARLRSAFMSCLYDDVDDIRPGRPRHAPLGKHQQENCDEYSGMSHAVAITSASNRQTTGGKDGNAHL